jgi:hypothetical protein
MPVTSSIEKIGPTKAAQYLRTNDNNRRLSENHVRYLAKQITGGLWQVSQPIIFDNDGKLIDGQHRLSAIIAAGLEVELLVVRGLSSRIFGIVDQGKNRSAADLHSLLGGKESCRHVAAAFSMMCGVKTDQKSASRQSLAEFAIEHAESIDRVSKALRKHRHFTSPIIAAFAVAGEKFGWALIDPMLERLSMNVFARDDDPINKLAGWCVNHHGRERRGSLGYAPRHTSYGAAVAAIRAALEGRAVRCLKPSNVDFGYGETQDA